MPKVYAGCPATGVVVYCRGAYLQFADRAVSILQRKGFDAIRLEGGWPEWRVEGRPIAEAVRVV